MRVVATAGHVDHGKSTLLRALTGMEPDRWAEERARGLTIDLGFVWTDFEGADGVPRTVAFVDVPGHERFVTNMLAGTGAVDTALFVVAADDGWNAQSQEHLEILDVLGIRGAAVCITKGDSVEAERRAAVVDDVTSRLDGTSLADAPVAVTDAISGRGLDLLRRVLVDRLEALPASPDNGRARLWVDRSFTVSGAGTVVTGTLAGGGVNVGDDLVLHPSGRPVRVRGLQALGRACTGARPGSRVALNLVGVDHADVGRGQALVRPDPPGWHVSTELEAWVRPLAGREVTTTGDWHLHVGSLETSCEVTPLLGSVDALAPGPVRIDLPVGVTLQHGDRFVLRESGTRRTVAGGTVLDPAPRPRPRGVAARLDRAEALEDLATAADATERVASLVRLHHGHLRLQTARTTFGTAGDLSGPGLEVLNDWVVDEGRLPDLLTATIDAARSEAGTPATTVVDVLRRTGCPPELARPLVDLAERRGLVRRHDDLLVAAEVADDYERGRRDRQQALVELLESDPLRPPDGEDAAAEFGLHASELRELLESRRVLRAGPVLFAASAVDEAVRRLNDACPGGGTFTAAEARELWGTSRKYALPLLELLARTGVTTFDGQHHRLQRPAPPGDGR